MYLRNKRDFAAGLAEYKISLMCFSTSSFGLIYRRYIIKFNGKFNGKFNLSFKFFGK